MPIDNNAVKCSNTNKQAYSRWIGNAEVIWNNHNPILLGTIRIKNFNLFRAIYLETNTK